MTLQKLLMQKELKNVNVKLHSVNGSSLFYAYKNNPYLINKTWEKMALNGEKTIRKAYVRLETYEQKLLETPKKAIKIRKKLERNILNTKNLIKNTKWDIEHPVLQRQVLECFDSLVAEELPCKVIYITGYEVGKYWLISEMEKDLTK